ncbi:Bifunctional dehydrogenase and ferrochelatase [Quaeritorhiza haematococci]|nr:Bifunctional dehydrogenase and ferrochelatase [Quaeritorhiza haematococci]
MPPARGEVKGGASLMVAYRLKNRHVLIVGGGKESSGRVFLALDADARVTIVCPKEGLVPDVHARIDRNEVTYIDREFEVSDLDASTHPKNGPVDMVLSCIDDPCVSRFIAELCRDRRIPVNCADIPDLCDFYFMAQYREGPLQIGISTNGCGPRLGARIRNMVRDAVVPKCTAAAVENIGRLRRRIREIDPDPESSRRRMRWLSRLCDGWSIEEMATMTEEEALMLIDLYERGEDASAVLRNKTGNKAQSNVNGHPSLPSPPPSPKKAPTSDTTTTTTTASVVELPSSDSAIVPVSSSASTPSSLITSVVTAPFTFTSAALKTAQTLTTTTLNTATSTLTTTSSRLSTALSSLKDTAECTVAAQLNKLPSRVEAPLRAAIEYVPYVRIPKREGQVILVGVGPGDPDLLTVGAVKAIRSADVIVADRILGDTLLTHIRKDILGATSTTAPPSVPIHFVSSKRSGQSDTAQSNANDLLLEHYSHGRVVVRIKGGDPFLFGRGAEEIQFLLSKGVPERSIKVIPGVSSCIAAPGAAGIPVTMRGYADQFLVLTGVGEGGVGLNDGDSGSSAEGTTKKGQKVPPYWEGRTIVILMAVKRMREVVDAFLQQKGPSSVEGGGEYPPDLPAAIIENGTRQEQRVVEGTLGDIATKCVEEEVKSPAILVIGRHEEYLEKLSDTEDEEEKHQNVVATAFGRKGIGEEEPAFRIRVAFFVDRSTTGRWWEIFDAFLNTCFVITYIINTDYPLYNQHLPPFNALADLVLAYAILLQYLPKIYISLDPYSTFTSIFCFLTFMSTAPVIVAYWAYHSGPPPSGDPSYMDAGQLALLYPFRFWRLHLSLMKVVKPNTQSLLLRLSPLTQKSLSIGLSIFSTLLTVTAWVHIIYDMMQNLALTFFDVFYFITVTSTTGLSTNIKTDKVVSRVVVLYVMIVGAIYLPTAIADLMLLLRKKSKYSQPFVASRKSRGRTRGVEGGGVGVVNGNGDDEFEGQSHVLVVGHLEINLLRDFLREFYCEDHGTETMNTKVVILNPWEPTNELVALLNNPVYVRRVQYVKGSPMSFHDLNKASAHTAKACFVLSSETYGATGSHSDLGVVSGVIGAQNTGGGGKVKSAAEIDAQAVMRAMAIKKYEPMLPLHVQVILPEHKSHFDDLGMLAHNCICPGFLTLCYILTTSVPESSINAFIRTLDGHSGKPSTKPSKPSRARVTLQGNNPLPIIPAPSQVEDAVTRRDGIRRTSSRRWLSEYVHGTTMEIYPVLLGPQFAGLVFWEAAERVYRLHKSILFAVGFEVGDEQQPRERSGEYEGEDRRLGGAVAVKVVINPAEYVLRGNEIAYVITKDSDIAQRIVGERAAGGDGQGDLQRVVGPGAVGIAVGEGEDEEWAREIGDSDDEGSDLYDGDEDLEYDSMDYDEDEEYESEEGDEDEYSEEDENSDEGDDGEEKNALGGTGRSVGTQNESHVKTESVIAGSSLHSTVPTAPVSVPIRSFSTPVTITSEAAGAGSIDSYEHHPADSSLPSSRGRGRGMSRGARSAAGVDSDAIIGSQGSQHHHTAMMLLAGSGGGAPPSSHVSGTSSSIDAGRLGVPSTQPHQSLDSSPTPSITASTSSSQQQLQQQQTPTQSPIIHPRSRNSSPSSPRRPPASRRANTAPGSSVSGGDELVYMGPKGSGLVRQQTIDLSPPVLEAAVMNAYVQEQEERQMRLKERIRAELGEVEESVEGVVAEGGVLTSVPEGVPAVGTGATTTDEASVVDAAPTGVDTKEETTPVEERLRSPSPKGFLRKLIGSALGQKRSRSPSRERRGDADGSSPRVSRKGKERDRGASAVSKHGSGGVQVETKSSSGRSNPTTPPQMHHRGSDASFQSTTGSLTPRASVIPASKPSGGSRFDPLPPDLKDHLLVCDFGNSFPPNLAYLIAPFRAKSSAPVIILNPNPPPVLDEEWEMLKGFGGVYYVCGSPLKREDLERGGVRGARWAVVLRSTTIGNIADRSADASALLVVLNIEALAQRNIFITDKTSCPPS